MIILLSTNSNAPAHVCPALYLQPTPLARQLDKWSNSHGIQETFDLWVKSYLLSFDFFFLLPFCCWSLWSRPFKKSFICRGFSVAIFSSFYLFPFCSFIWWLTTQSTPTSTLLLTNQMACMLLLCFCWYGKISESQWSKLLKNSLIDRPNAFI